MTQIRFLNGLDTIGGNIVEFTHDDSRVIMDFGTAADLTDETIATALENGKLPHVPELFDATQRDAFAHEAIFISHLHIDHMGALQYLAADIPIYLSRPSYRLYRTMIDLELEKPVANLQPMDFESPVTVGSFTVTGYASDHDEPGVMALLVEDGHRAYAHSGDVRLNGPHRDRVDHWASVFAKRNLAMFMLEGTSFSFDTPTPVEDTDHPSEPLSEMGLQETLTQQLKDTAGLVVVNPYNRNYERLAALQTAAHDAGRQMIWEPDMATILTMMTGVEPDYILGDTIDTASIAAAPDAYLLQNSFAQLATLDHLPVSLYLHTNGEPLGDYDPRFAQLTNWLADHQIPLAFLSASGHATREDLIALAQVVKPKIIVPWHSFHPEREAAALDEATGAEVLLPEKDLFYSMDED